MGIHQAADPGSRAAVADWRRQGGPGGSRPAPACRALHHGAQLKPVAVDAELAVAVHALDGKLNAFGSKAVSGVPGYGYAVDHARRAPKDASCAIESSTILSLPVRKWTCRTIESLFQLYT